MLTGSPVAALAPMPGGTFGMLHAVDLDDGRHLVAKTATGTNAEGTLETEGWMLRYLADRSDLPVPAVHHADPDLLLMDRLPAGGALDAGAEAHAGALIAALHDVAGEAFGLGRDTVIGPLVQPNEPDARWTEFLRDRRLMHMGRLAHEAGRLPGETLARLDAFCARIVEFVPEPAHPALLHGDLWTGNVLVHGGRISGFVDPAIYYGDPEMDLAFATLFGTLGEPFFAAYSERRPVAPGFFEARRDICNLWPLLVHARLFGGSYGASVDAILRRFV